MSDRRDSDSDNVTIEEATVGVKADVKTLQQLSSSGRAAQKKRDDNQARKGFMALDDAMERHLNEENEEIGDEAQGTAGH
ncbi:hypothetical protein BDV25DRAFT_2891 [Aspergillus avenaceus]|uniref:Uncharacterized protein n=1 Tax=Aspergillus avenaceus TaxID=36643 RepID=A0A5N6TSQ4_ASPAV|nr:hypothetical protein BDV25DRAFT_2891 [Aspergillus avenaceus]